MLTIIGKNYIWLVSFTASIGGLLFGYDTGSISVVLVYLQDSLGHKLFASEKELITSPCSAGSADVLGCGLFTAGAVLLATSYSVPQMAVGREVVVINYALGAALAGVPLGWRYMVGLGGVPSVLLLAMLLPLCSEPPRQLIYQDKHDAAAKVLQRIFSHDYLEDVQSKESPPRNEGRSKLHVVKRFNVLMYYSGTLFALVGFSNLVAVRLVVSGTNLLMTWVNIDGGRPFGRRRLLVSTMWGCQQKKITTPAIVVLAFIIRFVLFYGVSIGNTPWMNADFFPMEVRAIGAMYMACLLLWGSEPHRLLNILVNNNEHSPLWGLWLLRRPILYRLVVEFFLS
ncbi:major facilitator superfamily domain-containing protein [Aspergillus alliaceus]|uniref:major facilitator superfamily domain-containing protein n=1 Tax=Petromyces alliaceus TaxID=209559 RepID=UPI0012A5C82E|nr:major facilitator superfamily domain-containing protein [Aspergillus alliaceus]KAB8227183.1 major facilitator superfamily domain-containing protein [Aspergillus alliaceus]